MSRLSIPDPHAEAAQRLTAPGWVLFAFDGLRFVVPQKDVKTIELHSALQIAVDGEAQTGWYEQAGELWPAYSLDRNLALQAHLPRARQFCVFMEAAGKVSGVLCDHVSILESDDELAVQPMARCLVAEHSPLRGLGLHNGEVVLATRSADFAAYLANLEQAYVESD